jgi:hypothetical protein
VRLELHSTEVGGDKPTAGSIVEIDFVADDLGLRSSIVIIRSIRTKASWDW